MKTEKFVTIVLIRDGEVHGLRYKWNKLKQKAHAAKELAKFAKQGWQLQDIHGNAEAVEQLKKILAEHKTTGKIPIKTMMKESGLTVLPGFLKKRLDEEPESSPP